jgi:hypothetical protein
MGDLEAKKAEEEVPKAEATEEKKQEQEPQAEAEAGAEAAQAGGEQEEEKKPQVAPRVHISNPSSGAAYPFNSKLPIDIECEGSGEFNGEVQLRNGQGKLVYGDKIAVKMGPENKGHYQLVIDLNAIEEGATDRSGSYQLHAFGADETGLQAPMSRINIDLLDEEKAKTPNMPKDVANAPDDGGAGDAA